MPIDNDDFNAPLRNFRCACFGSTLAGGTGPEGLDPAVRPQDDLFRAANGRWLRETPMPADRSRHGSFSQLADRVEAQLHDLFEALAAAPRPGSPEARVGTFYTAWLDTDAIDAAGLTPVRAALGEIDALDTAAALARWLGRRQGLQNTPVRLGVAADGAEPDVERALTWQGGLGLPDRDHYLDTADPRQRAAHVAYGRYLERLAALAGDADAAGTAAAVLALEGRIAKVHWSAVENRDALKLFNPMTPDALARQAPGFDWAAFLGAAGLGAIAHLSVSQPSFCAGIATLIAEVPLATWRQHARLHLLDAAAPMLPAAFREARFAFRGTVLTGALEERPRWQLAIAAVNTALGDAVGRLYVERHFGDDRRQAVEAMVGHLLAAYRGSIDALAWMSPVTKVRAQAKLAKMRTRIGFPTRWRSDAGLDIRPCDALGNTWRAAAFEWARLAAKADGPVDREEWPMTPQTVNACYDPSRNEIVFPAAILQAPFFDPAADAATNYGAIGAVIGHEISHGFDDQGSRFDADGALRNWWSDADRAAFDALGARLVAQYGAFEPLPGGRVDGRLTLGENIADVSGLQIAFKAMRRACGADSAVAAQRFFVGWARAWREKVREERARVLLTVDPHAPAECRANGAAVNHDAFHAAFATAPGDAMFRPADERIRVW